MGSFIAKPHRGEMLAENGLMLFTKPHRGEMLVEKIKYHSQSPIGARCWRPTLGRKD